MFESIGQLILCGMVIITVSILLYLVNRYTKFKKIPYIYRQIIYGVIFGGLAIMATELGYVTYGAVANVRDSAPLVVGLVFGGPAGIIAGTIGAVERLISGTIFYRGMYTVYPCSLSTFLAGLIAFGIRKFMFKNECPPFGFGLMSGVVVEAMHLLFIFLFHLSEPYEVVEILRQIAVAMVIANALIVFVVTLVVRTIDTKHLILPTYKRDLNTKMQAWLLIIVVSSALLSNGLLYTIQNNFANETAESVLIRNVDDVSLNIEKYSDQLASSINDVARDVYEKEPTLSASEVKERLKTLYTGTTFDPVVEVNLVTREGVVIDSSTPTHIGYRMEEDALTLDFHQSIMWLPLGDVYSQYFQESETDHQLYKYSASWISKDVSSFDGYIQTSINTTILYSSGISNIIKQVTQDRRVYEHGYFIIFDNEGHIVSDISAYEYSTLLIDPNNFSSEADYSLLRGKIWEEDSVNSFYMYNQIETYYVLASFLETDLTNSRDSVLYLFNLSSILIYAIIFIFTFFLVNNMVVRRIQKINDILYLIIAGDLNQKVDVRNSIEFNNLSDDINYTVDTLKDYIDKAAKRIDAELAFAKKVQESSLPSVFPAFPNHHNFDIYATMDAARQVGGDFYDFYLLNHNILAFLVADVSGKGIAASMFMMEAKTMLKNFANMGNKVNEVFNLANNGLDEGNDANMFVTCWMGIINLDTGHIAFSNAGHNYPLIYRHKKKKWEYLKQKKNVVLAGFKDAKYDKQKLDVEPGDKIYLYTDGVTEATSKNEELYGEERLINYLNAHISDDNETLLKGIKKDIELFVDGEEQFDDMTMLIFEYKGNN